ncbi:MAG TPA: FtsQ-type POTRA domain-containing protein [Granulicella sp.]
MRSTTSNTKRGAALLEEPEQEYVSATRRSRSATKSRNDFGEDFADSYESPRSERKGGLRLKWRMGIPKSLAGRIFSGVVLLFIAGAGVGLLMLVRNFLLHDQRFMIASPASIEIQGNQHLTRPQLLSIFGEDVGRNIFRISLDDRRAELEQLPWVEHATIMRLLPNRIRVSLTERTPIAFARQGGRIGLVDENGVLLDMSGAADHKYSFPVVTGIVAADPDSTRSARMRIYSRFVVDLDSGKEKISQTLSEVDLSNPEDVKALIPSNSTSILVHFGEDHFLERYQRFKEHLAAWQTQYPNLASVDMRYEREVVLDMVSPHGAAPAAKAPDASTLAKPVAPVPAAKETAAKPAVPVKVAPAKAAPHKDATPAKADAKAKPPVKAKPSAKTLPRKPAAPVAKAAPVPAKPVAAAPTPSSPKPSAPPAASASAAARSGFHAKPSAGKPVDPSSSPAQVPSR